MGYSVAIKAMSLYDFIFAMLIGEEMAGKASLFIHTEMFDTFEMAVAG